MPRYTLLAVILALFTIKCHSQSNTSFESKVINDLLYVPKNEVQNDTLQRLNLVVPEGIKDFPLFVWVGGGAWSYVNRSMEMNLAMQFADKGIAVASIGHRLSTATWKDPALNQGIKHPEHIKDLARALKWLYDHADEYGYDPRKIFVGGYSSGGHLAALLSLDEKYLEHHGLSTRNIQGVVPIAGAYDISDYHQAFANGSRKELADLHVKAVFGDTEVDFREASPTSYVQQMTVPMLLISESGTYNYTKIFEDKIRASSFADFEVLHVRELGHAELWRNLSFEENSVYRGKIIDFIQKRSRAAQ